MKYLGIDFGLRRVGLATSEGELAAPFKTMKVNNFQDAVSKVLEQVKVAGYNKIVVGLPEGWMKQNVLGFVSRLKKDGIEVETFDETLSSKKAKQTMIELGVPVKKRRHEDAYSAAHILQDYLDSL